MLDSFSNLFEKLLRKILEKKILVQLRKLSIDRCDIDKTEFKDLQKIEMEILINNLMLSLANIGIVIMIFFLIYEITKNI